MNKPICAAILSTACMLFSVTAFGDNNCGPTLETVATYATGDVPESITLDDSGNAYLSVGNTIRKRTPSGQESTFSTLPIAAFALGVKVGPDGCVYNVSTSLDPTIVGAFLWRTCTPGTAQLFATFDPAGGPNDLAFDDDGNAFVTDQFLGRIYKVRPNGSTSIWLDSPLFDGNPAAPFLVFHAGGSNGIAFDKDRENVYVGNLDYGKIIRVPVRNNGTAGTPTVWISDARLQGIDGFAFDKEGTIYAAINGQDKLVSISANKQITVLGSGLPLDGPSSVVFGVKGNDKRSIYVTSSAFTRTFGLQAGTPHPALLKVDVDEKGLPLL